MVGRHKRQRTVETESSEAVNTRREDDVHAERRRRTRTVELNEPSCDTSHERAYSSAAATRSIDRLTDVMATFLEAQTRSHIETTRRPSMLAKGDAVPFFDPDDKNQSIEKWCNKIDELRILFHWTEDLTIYYALAKLKGLAAVWYRGLSSINYTWEEWKAKLQRAFPSQRDYNEIVEEMMHRKKKLDETYGRYFYEKQALLTACKIQGRDAVSCIIGGIHEAHIKAAARAGNFEDPEALYGYLRTLNDGVSHTAPSHYRKHPQELSASSRAKLFNDLIRCHKCGQRGHKSMQCRTIMSREMKKCGYCQKLGHEEAVCYRKKREQQNKSGVPASHTVA